MKWSFSIFHKKKEKKKLLNHHFVCWCCSRKYSWELQNVQESIFIFISSSSFSFIKKNIKLTFRSSLLIISYRSLALDEWKQINFYNFSARLIAQHVWCCDLLMLMAFTIMMRLTKLFFLLFSYLILAEQWVVK